LGTSSFLNEFRDQTSTGTTLGVSHIPSICIQRYGQPIAGIRRSTLNLALKAALVENNIPVHEGWKLEDIKEKEDGVVALFEGGRRIEGMFLIGCDGIKAASRDLLLQKKGLTEGAASYTGLTQVKLAYILLQIHHL
jgi:salicylate hydroxylase